MGGDVELEALYAKLSGHTFAQGWHTPIHTHVSADGTAEVTVLDRHRWTRAAGTQAVEAWSKDHAGQWIKIKPRLEYDKHGHEPRGVLMWPIRSVRTPDMIGATPTNALHMALNGALDDLRARRPEYQTDPVLRKKVSHLHKKVIMTWRHRLHRYVRPQFFNAVRFWWAHMVDKDVARAFIAVNGASQGSLLSWDGYAVVSQTENIAKMCAHVQSLGVAGRLLAPHHPSTWGTHTATTLIPAAWSPHWAQLLSYPKSLQEAVVAAIIRPPKPDSEDFSVAWSSDPPPPTTPPPTALACWKVFEALSPHWRPTPKPAREWLMLWVALCQVLTQDRQDGPAAAPGLTPDRLADSLERMVVLFRHMDPSGYRRWSHTDRSSWLTISKTMIIGGRDKGLVLAVPENVPHLKAWDTAHESLLLEEATSGQPQRASSTRRM